MENQQKPPDWLQQNTAFAFQVLSNLRTRQNRKFGGVWATGGPLTSDPVAPARFEVREKELNTVRSVSPSTVDLGCANTKLCLFGRRSRWGCSLLLRIYYFCCCYKLKSFGNINKKMTKCSSRGTGIKRSGREQNKDITGITDRAGGRPGSPA